MVIAISQKFDKYEEETTEMVANMKNQGWAISSSPEKEEMVE